MAMRDGTLGRDAGFKLLPSGSGDFLRRRLFELAGLALGTLALALAAACLSFDPADPSLNHATDGPVANLLGLPGAYYADVLYQSLGLAGFVLPAALLGLAWRLLRHRPVARWPLRLALLPVAMVLAAMALAAAQVPPTWPIDSGLGGVGGDLLLGWASQRSGVEPRILAGCAGLLGLAVLLYLLGITWREWRAGAGKLLWLSGGARRGLAGLAKGPRRLVALVRRRTAAERREPLLDGAAEPDDGPVSALSEGSSGAKAGGKSRGKSGGKSGLVAPRAPRVAPGRRGRTGAQRRLDLGPTGDYELPGLVLLEAAPTGANQGTVNRDSLEKNARLLETVLSDFGVKGEIVKVRPGPVVTRYDLEPAPGTKTSRVVGLADDIARSMSAISVRVAVVPGSSVIGIELPNTRREVVYLRELLGAKTYERAGGKLPLVLGKDISGSPIIVDLVRMPHLLIAGTTGSGKSVSVNVLILSLLYRLTPEACKFIMIDPKMLELSVYEGIPHLLAPVVTEPKKAVVALKWTVREMEERYRAMSRLGVRNIEGYNARIEEARRTGEVLTRRVQTGFDPDTGQPVHEEQPFDLSPLPFIVVVVDEMADLMLVAGKEIEATVQRLAQMARAAGIHLIMATQRPSVDVITGTIKANFPTRISFHVTSKIDSRTILGEMGAEQLLGQGDMLYMAHGGRITRVHGPLVTDQEVEDVVDHLKRQGQPAYIESVTEDEDDQIDGFETPGGTGDELYDQAVAVVCQHRKASTSFIQRHLQIGYNRAARIIEKMESEGVVSPANHVGKREVLVLGAGDT
jgi:S-DNA-T family DNA segregation ATPase FtsK/SpoIIIE